MFDVQGFILVGGASTRMGKDKARLMFGAQNTVELIANALRSVTQRVTTVGWPHQKIQNIPNFPDARPNWGPLAGIESALRHAESKHSLIVACDFPFVTESLFQHLLAFIDDSDAVVPLQNDDRPQPLCAIYRVATCLPAAAAAIAADQHSPRALLDRVRTRYLPFAELSLLEGSEHFFFNVNTPENYDRAQCIFDQLQCQNRER
jgi:molybdopterin-guanine dinucleotide biosynthesis protein A